MVAMATVMTATPDTRRRSDIPDDDFDAFDGAVPCDEEFLEREGRLTVVVVRASSEDMAAKRSLFLFSL
jgi:hypothetical protein